MPIYEYQCKNCNEKFEEFQSLGAGNEGVICPKCGSSKPEKLFSAFSSSGVSNIVPSGSSCGPAGSPFS